MIRELEQIKLLLENINGNLGGKTSEKHDFGKKTPSLKQSQKEAEQEKILLKYISNHLTPETKIGKETTDLKKKSKSLTQSLKEIEQEKLILNVINNQLMTKDSKYKDILDTLTAEFKTPLIPIKIYSSEPRNFSGETIVFTLLVFFKTNSSKIISSNESVFLVIIFSFSFCVWLKSPNSPSKRLFEYTLIGISGVLNSVVSVSRISLYLESSVKS